jgi:hypothetical protein
MATQPDDDKFFEVLAGRRQPDDADTRQAARLRQYYQMHPTAEERPQPDPAGQARLLAYLRAREGQPAPGAAPATTPPAKPGPLQRLLAWLLPPGPGRGMRLGMALAGVLGVAVLVRMVAPPDDDHLTPKSGGPLAAETVKYAADPAQDAAQIQALLAGVGIPVTLTVQGREVLLRADIPPEQLAAVTQALSARGLTPPADGRLVLRIKPL